MPIRFVDSEEDFNNYVQNTDGLVAYFTASWCGPCEFMLPIVDQLHDSLTNIDIVRIDIDSFQELVSRLEITAVPTFVFYNKSAETHRVRGANLKAVTEGIQNLSQAVGPDAKRYVTAESVSGSVDNFETSEESSQVSRYIPNGFSVLNGSIFFGDFESLNTETVDSSADIKDLVRKTPETLTTTIVSDADSQLLIHIPLTNVSKVYSVLVKTKKDAKFEDEAVQAPNKIKIWANNTSIISFDHATSVSSLHDEVLEDEKWDANGWYEFKLKYVRFQKVSTIDIFLDGDDEDGHTSIDRILLVGIDGGSKNQGKLEKIAD